ncbi:hypothetical protein C5Y41_06745 [Rahnella variigena]|nr:hypothetical protein C5Y41_06745 [Rahnella variigena]
MNRWRRFGLTDVSVSYFLRDIAEENTVHLITVKKRDRMLVRDHTKRRKQAEIRDSFRFKKNHK